MEEPGQARRQGRVGTALGQIRRDRWRRQVVQDQLHTPGMVLEFGQEGTQRMRVHVQDARAGSSVRLQTALLARMTAEYVSTATGSLPLCVTLSVTFPRGVARSHKGRWPQRAAVRANVNVLHPGRKAAMGGNTCVHSVAVTVTPRAATAGVPRRGMPASRRPWSEGRGDG